MLVHANPGAFADDRERARLLDPAWRVHLTAASTELKSVEETPFLDAALIFREPDPTLAWNLAAAVLRRFPDAPVVMITDVLSASERHRAAVAGVTLIESAVFADRVRTAHAAVKYRLHRGTYHYATHVLTDCDLSVGQFLCLLLALEGLAHKDITAKLSIAGDMIRNHLSEAARKTRSPNVPAMLATLRANARREAAARNGV